MMLNRFGRQMIITFVVVGLAFLVVSLMYLPAKSPSAVNFSQNQQSLLKNLANRIKYDIQEDPLRQSRLRNKALLGRVKTACESLNISLPLTSFMLAHMHYDDQHRAVYCFVPKVACTSWKRIWMKLTGIVPPEMDVSKLDRYQVHTRLPNLSSHKNKEEVLKTYKKFMFVRHPFQRILSAYRDKLESEDRQSGYDFHKKIGLKIESRYRGTTAGQGNNVTFAEFIRFISEPGYGTTEQRNEHWLSVHEICNPCAVQYDFIGKYETLSEDARYVLDWLGANGLANAFPKSDRPFNASGYQPKYFNQLNHQQKMMFFTKYLADFVAFDYDFVPGETAGETRDTAKNRIST